jgi:hypothetical protein
MKTRQIFVVAATALIAVALSPTLAAERVDFSTTLAARMQGERELLPEYPGAVHLHQVNTDEHSSFTVFYGSNDSPDRIVNAYVSYFLSHGWRMEKKPWVEVGHSAADNTRSSTLTTALVKDDLRVSVEAERNIKDPDQGATKFSVSFTAR